MSANVLESPLPRTKRGAPHTVKTGLASIPARWIQEGVMACHVWDGAQCGIGRIARTPHTLEFRVDAPAQCMHMLMTNLGHGFVAIEFRSGLTAVPRYRWFLPGSPYPPQYWRMTRCGNAVTAACDDGRGTLSLTMNESGRLCLEFKLACGVQRCYQFTL